jgi:hypothetical protein
MTGDAGKTVDVDFPLYEVRSSPAIFGEGALLLLSEKQLAGREHAVTALTENSVAPHKVRVRTRVEFKKGEVLGVAKAHTVTYRQLRPVSQSSAEDRGGDTPAAPAGVEGSDALRGVDVTQIAQDVIDLFHDDWVPAYEGDEAQLVDLMEFSGAAGRFQAKLCVPSQSRRGREFVRQLAIGTAATPLRVHLVFAGSDVLKARRVGSGFEAEIYEPGTWIEKLADFAERRRRKRRQRELDREKERLDEILCRPEWQEGVRLPTALSMLSDDDNDERSAFLDLSRLCFYGRLNGTWFDEIAAAWCPIEKDLFRKMEVHDLGGSELVSASGKIYYNVRFRCREEDDVRQASSDPTVIYEDEDDFAAASPDEVPGALADTSAEVHRIGASGRPSLLPMHPPLPPEGWSPPEDFPVIPPHPIQPSLKEAKRLVAYRVMARKHERSWANEKKKIIPLLTSDIGSNDNFDNELRPFYRACKAALGSALETGG